MDEKQIRTPQQQRAIEKKERIINAGLELFCEKGYYNTNTAEIAKRAGVSTGIVYSYFKNKNDILSAVISVFSHKLQTTVRASLENFDFSLLMQPEVSTETLTALLKKIIEYSAQTHMQLKNMHQELNAMENDPHVAKFLLEFELETSNLIKHIFEKSGILLKNADEKIHLIFHIVEDYCHEAVFHQHDFIDYDVYLEESIQAIIFLVQS